MKSRHHNSSCKFVFAFFLLHRVMKETPAHCPLHLQFNFIDYNVLSYKTMGEAVLSRAVDLSGHRRPSKGYTKKTNKKPPHNI